MLQHVKGQDKIERVTGKRELGQVFMPDTVDGDNVRPLEVDNFLPIQWRQDCIEDFHAKQIAGYLSQNDYIVPK
jgi:hypothetical protein